ncbi:RRM_XMAS2 and SAC3_GANP domain-containing protein xmas [Musca autumnalis]|uniref:RRM_XMAS2 and SAC3_GANP domain-containing protein xmas n=1 Tax=Musca autumnalis TaxID=221902 RepID=UPI003CF70840
MSEDGEYEAHDDNTNYKAISCEKIPELFLDKLVAKKYFSKYGKISRFILKPKRLSCTVEYENEEDAERAYMDAGEFNGIEFLVNYAENKPPQVQSTEEWVDPDVQSELDAMNPGHRSAAGGMRSLFSASPAAAKLSSLPRQMVTKPPSTSTTATVLPTIKPIKATRTDSPQPDVPKIDASVRSELEAILRRPAFTDEDKYRVLDARDKLIRLTTVRQTDIKKAVATKGTCPDMCPEKERLMREFQRQVSTFEMDDDENSQSTICHRKAIKEYSRSSADQEVPLSHELRSESVLQMTMLYLMHRIMDLCDDPQTSLGDWFHFVWDRTRSIRKDITQQELCSLGGVQLVEQCARFHIHCAARLVAEDPSVFDKKINAENLTKCLQTLKYMYHDLRIKGVECPRESEFRSYIILLNLGDSNFLWELKQLPEAIQKSAEIKRAIAFYNALQNNNYVRFFSMVRSERTSYLEACILLGYFNRLRLRAMEVIIKSHNWRKNDVFLPLSYLTNALGFDDEAAAVHFLSYHGLQCDESEDRVLLERIQTPDMEFSMDRALKLVESKRLVSVGECICGEPLPSAKTFEEHQTHSSFDANGLLRADAWSALDQLRGEEAQRRMEERKQQQSKQPISITTTTTSSSSSGFLKPPDNIFKMPQASPPISPKQLQRKSVIGQTAPQEQPAKSIFGSIAANKEDTRSSSPAGGFKFSVLANKEETRSSSPGGFKFGGNIFGGNASTTVQQSDTMAAAATFKPVQESSAGASIFKLPTASINPTAQQGSSNLFQTSIFKPTAEKPATATAASANIFGGFSKVGTESKPAIATGTSIFGSAAKETANIFQQQSSGGTNSAFKSDNVFQHFQTKPQMSIFGDTSSSSSSATSFLPSQPSKPGGFPSLTSAQEMEQRKLQLEKEHEMKQKQLEEERRKLKELEEKRLREKREKEEQKQKELERQRREQLRQACIQKAAEESQAIIGNVLQEELEQLAREELRKYQMVQQASQLQLETLLGDVVQDLVEDIAHEEYAVMCYDQLLLNRYFNRWLIHLRKKREQRKLMESTPIWVTTNTRSQFAQALEHPCQESNLEMIKRYRMGQPCDFKQLMRLGENSPLAEGVHQTKPLCLFTLVGRHLLAKQNLTPAGLLQQRQYFKFVISIPSDKEELPGFETFCNKWLFKHIRKAQLETGPFVHGLENNMALCVRKLSGIYPHNEQGDEMRNEGDHSDGVVFILSGEEFNARARRRLYNLLKNSKNYKKIPVAIIAYNCLMRKEVVAQMLDLDTLEEEDMVCKYKILGHGVSRKDFSFRKAIKDAIDFITTESYKENCQELQSLAMENVLSFLDSSLGEEVFYRWQESARNNPVFQKICQKPEYVEGIYHKALEQLINITQEDFSEMPEFPEELKEFVPQNNNINIPLGLEFFPAEWKNDKGKKVLLKFLRKLHLPSIRDTPPPSPNSNLEDLELWILNYASRCLPHDDIEATKVAHECISNAIQQLRKLAALQYHLPPDERLQHLNYLTILKPIIFSHINHNLKEFCAELKNAPVIYNKRDLYNYQTQPWWLNCQPLDMVNYDHNSEENSRHQEQSLQEEDLKENAPTPKQLEEIIAQAENTARKVETNLFAIKQKKTTALKKSPASHKTKQENLQLKRTLDESLYKFELSKKIGQYDTSYIDNLTQDIDNSIHEVLHHEDAENSENHYHSSPEGPRKRKRLSPLKHQNSNTTANNNPNKIDDVIARAMSLIQKVDAMEDRRHKLNVSQKFRGGI